MHIYRELRNPDGTYRCDSICNCGECVHRAEVATEVVVDDAG